MQARRIDSAAEFLRLTLELRERHPLTTNVMGSVATNVAEGRYPQGLFWIAFDGEYVCAAAMRTPPHMLLVSPGHKDAIAALLPLVTSEDPDWQEVLATPATAATLRDIVGGPFEKGMHEWVYRLDRLLTPECSGASRRSTADDYDVVFVWLTEFSQEAGVLFAPNEDHLRARVAGGGFTMWEIDSRPVAMASHAALVETGSHRIGRIGPVYTEPAFRGRGIGGAVTARVAQDLIDQGCTTVMLHTDAANATSNGVYSRIGFVKVDELEVWKRA